MSVTVHSRLLPIAAGLQPALTATARDGAERIAEGARQRVSVRSGELRDRIEVERVGVGSYAVVANTFYAHMVEMGTDVAPPYPFMIPAFEAEKDGIVDDAARRVMAL